MAQEPFEAVNAEALIGQVLDGRYKVESTLGAGGMGMVFKGLQTSVQRPIALKTLHPQLAMAPTFFERFKREAEIASRLHHPNIITIFDFGKTPEGLCYYVMEYLEGESLRQRVKRQGPLTLREAAAIIEQCAAGIAHAHHQNVVHRDIKPHNIMLSTVDGDEYVKVLDFGLVKAVEQEEEEHLTSTGQVLGTPQYMPPEQAGGEAVDQRSDLFSLMGVFFYCLTGHSPYGANSVRKALTLSLQGNVPAVATYRQGAPVPEAIDKFIFKGLRPEKEDRFQTCEDFMQALHAALAGVPDSVLDAVPKFVSDSEGGSSSAASRKSGASRAKGVTAVSRPLPKGSRAGTSRVDEPSRPSQASSASASQAQGVPMGAVIGAMLTLVLIVGGAVAWKLTRPTETPPAPQPAPAPIAKVEPKPAEPPVATDLKVTLKTSPDAAEISEDGVAIGSTPHTLTWKPGATRTLTFKLAGFKELTKTLRPEGDQTFEYPLEPLPKQGAPRKVTPKKSDDIGTFD